MKGYEIQVWLWDFRSSPGDPNYGNMRKRFVFECNEENTAETAKRIHGCTCSTLVA